MKMRTLAAAAAALVTMPLAALVASPASADTAPVTACQSAVQAEVAEDLLERFRDPSPDPVTARTLDVEKFVRIATLGVPQSDFPGGWRVGGDVNGDADITALDAALAYQVVDGQRTADSCAVLVADVDDDGYLTLSDVSEIQRMSVGL